MSPLIVRRRNRVRYGRAADDDSINVVVAMFVSSEFVEHFHCLFLSPLMVARGSICNELLTISSCFGFLILIIWKCALIWLPKIFQALQSYLWPTLSSPFPVVGITWIGTTEPIGDSIMFTVDIVVSVCLVKKKKKLVEKFNNFRKL